jgi:hypothetical protein
MFYPTPQIMALRRGLHTGVLARWRWLGAFQKGGVGLHTPVKLMQNTGNFHEWVWPPQIWPWALCLIMCVPFTVGCYGWVE